MPSRATEGELYSTVPVMAVRTVFKGTLGPVGTLLGSTGTLECGAVQAPGGCSAAEGRPSHLLSAWGLECL